MRFILSEILNIDGRAIVRTTELFEMRKITFCYAVNEGKLEDQCQVDSASMNATKQGMW